METEPTYKRQNLVTVERFLKGDLDVTRDAAGYINRASVVDKSALASLLASGILNYHHYAAACIYAVWQYAFQKPFYAEPRKIYLIDVGEFVAGLTDPVSSYRLLLRKIGRETQNIVEAAIIKDISPALDVQRVVKAFDLLIRLIEEIDGDMQKNACTKHATVTS